MKSEHLRIKVSENGQTKADVTLKAELASQLPSFVPESVRSSVEKREIDLEQIAADAVSSDFEAGVLFELQEGTKHVIIWLE